MLEAFAGFLIVIDWCLLDWARGSIRYWKGPYYTAYEIEKTLNRR